VLPFPVYLGRYSQKLVPVTTNVKLVFPTGIDVGFKLMQALRGR